jgi:membrane-bound serine protease (ClpP class)
MMHLILSIAGLDFSGLEGLIVILFILGIALVVIEMVMPGIGAAGILGVISLIAGVILAAQVVSFTALILIILVVLLIITGMLVWLYNSAVKGGRVSRLLMLNTQTSREEGYSSTSATEDLVGLEGIATTVLRPAGTGDFQGRKLDVVTDGGFIPKGTPIRITQVEGFRIVVEKSEDKSSD